MSFLKTRTRIVQLAIAMVALAAMTFGAVSVQANTQASGPHVHLTANGVGSTYDANGDGTAECTGDLVPAGNGAWGGIMTCTDGSLMAVIAGLGVAVVAPGGNPVVVELNPVDDPT